MRRKKIRIISFTLATIAVLFVWGAVSSARLTSLEREINASKERALTSLGAYVGEIRLNLDKSVYASTGTSFTRLSGEIWRDCAAAKLSLSEITDEKAEYSGVYKFLSQAGEYTKALGNKLSSNEKIDEDEREKLKKLNLYAEALDEKLSYLLEEQENGGLSFEEIESTLKEDNEELLNFGEELESISDTEENYPTLIYDGPYSDHIENRGSELLGALDEVGRSAAQKKAEEFLKLSSGDLYFLSESGGNMPCYTFYNSSYTVSVTKKGGIVSYVLSSKYVGESKISEEEAVKAAYEFLENRGYTSVKDTYYADSDGICTVNFAYFEGDVIYYTDLIKVSVSLEDGAVTAFEATGYLMNHKNRTVKHDGYKYTPENAKGILAASLEVINVKKAVIPTDYMDEKFVYEYHVKAEGGKELLIYINPDTGEEEDILELLYYDGGVLTK